MVFICVSARIHSRILAQRRFTWQYPHTLSCDMRYFPIDYEWPFETTILPTRHNRVPSTRQYQPFSQRNCSLGIARVFWSRPNVALAAVLCASAGCALQPDLAVVAPTVVATPPPQWAAGSSAQSFHGAWLEDLESPGLRTLIHEALSSNPQLVASAARLRAASAQAAIAGAAQQPQVDARANASRQGTASSPTQRQTNNRFELRLDASWEADIWGRLNHATSAASFDAKAAAQDFEAARLSLAANIAQAWFDAVTANLQLRLAEETVANFAQNLAIVEEGFRAGLGSALDVRLERANLATARSRVASRGLEALAVRRELEVLLGRYPAADISTTEALPTLQRSVPLGLPAQLLGRRPDIRAAQATLAASSERYASARKNRLPSFRLTAAGGFSSGELRHLLDFNSLLWNIAGNLAASLTRGGELAGESALAAARRDEALANYAGAVLTALREVEGALSAEAFLAIQESELRRSADEAEAAATLALERYRRGLIDIVTWLDARRRTFDAKSSLIQTSNARVQNRIALHLALGGDFELAATAATGVDGGAPGPRAPSPMPN
jgi:multidrug efflux system outer membrane protein